jgi:hypothetical protein
MNGTDSIGTIRAGRRLLPWTVMQTKFSDKDAGKIEIAYSDFMDCFSWMDRREVRLLSTISSPEMHDVAVPWLVNTVRPKPLAISVYNRAMPGLDLADQKRHGRNIAKKRLRRWHKKALLHLIDIALVNAYCVARHIPGMEELKHQEFRLLLIRAIFTAHPKAQPGRMIPKTRVPEDGGVPSRMIERHTHIIKCQTSNNRGVCIVCYARGKKNVKTWFKCYDCDRHLCIDPCFHIYHTQDDYTNGDE